MSRLQEPEWAHRLLVRRSADDPMKLAYNLVCAPAGTTLEELSRVAKRH